MKRHKTSRRKTQDKNPLSEYLRDPSASAFRFIQHPPIYMNNDTPFTTIGDEPIEARIVAWVLGEASAFEAAELERLCEERPELLLFRRRMIALHGLLTEAETAQPAEGWKLPPEKRKPLDEISGQEKVVNLEDAKEKRRAAVGAPDLADAKNSP
jgi:hypothetical protein